MPLDCADSRLLVQALLQLWLVLCLGSTATAEEDAGINQRSLKPQACVGYNPFTRAWGPAWGARDPVCPGQYGFFSLDDPLQRGGGEIWPLWDMCCPLPAEDMLSGESIVVVDTCPDNFIVTGTVPREGPPPWRGNLLHCTRLGPRFMLGPGHPGVYWGLGSEHARWWLVGSWFRHVEASFTRRDLPVSMRFAVGRRALTDWDADGCVGYPFGAVLTAVGRKSCSDHTFREVLFSGQEGDPPAGTPVKMLPDCVRISDIFDPDPQCSEGDS